MNPASRTPIAGRRGLVCSAILREALADYFVFDNRYGSTDVAWRKYFHSFPCAVAIGKGR